MGAANCWRRLAPAAGARAADSGAGRSRLPVVVLAAGHGAWFLSRWHLAVNGGFWCRSGGFFRELALARLGCRDGL
jgi:hypothetical protein